jgi:hypothetical protein
MKIEYFQPLSRGIARMKQELFNPFDLTKWFVVGFTAFLAGFGEFKSSGVPNSGFRRNSNISMEDVFDFPRRAMEWLAAHPVVGMIICIALVLGLVVGIILTWLSSRGKFMLLDNVVKNQAKIADPWREYRMEGNSLFRFCLGFGLIMLAVVVAYISYCFMSIHAVFEKSGSGQALIFPAILALLGLLVITIVGSFISMLLRDFVVPIMYRDHISTIDAIQKFSVILSSNLIHFIGYGLFLFVLWLAIMIGIVIVGCGTCCIGFIVLMIPYIGAVALLPITYSIRAFSVEFLEQFGPAYEIFPKPDTPPPDPQALTV